MHLVEMIYFLRCNHFSGPGDSPSAWQPEAVPVVPPAIGAAHPNLKE